MTAKKDAPTPKGKKPEVTKETVKDLAPKGDEVKGGAATATCTAHAQPRVDPIGT